MLTPTYIFTDDFLSLADYFQAQPHTRRTFRAGEHLWVPDEPFGRIHYILSGVARNSVEHELGFRKIVSFHGPGTVFPGYHEKDYKIERALITIALTDMAVLEFDKATFRRMFHESREVRERVIDWFSSYTNLLLYESAHQEFNSAFVKLCNLLHLLTTAGSAAPAALPDRLALTQDTLAEVLGVSRVNLTRALTRLRREGIVRTGRGELRILNPEALKGHCSCETL